VRGWLAALRCSVRPFVRQAVGLPTRQTLTLLRTVAGILAVNKWLTVVNKELCATKWLEAVWSGLNKRLEVQLVSE